MYVYICLCIHVCICICHSKYLTHSRYSRLSRLFINFLTVLQNVLETFLFSAFNLRYFETVWIPSPVLCALQAQLLHLFPQLTLFVFFFFSLSGSLRMYTNLFTWLPENTIFPMKLPKMDLEIVDPFPMNRPRELPFHCEKCNKRYQHRFTLLRHTRYECGQEPKIQCPYCSAKMKQRGHVYRHIRRFHQDKEIYAIDLNWEFMEKYNAGCLYQGLKAVWKISLLYRYFSVKKLNTEIVSLAITCIYRYCVYFYR